MSRSAVVVGLGELGRLFGAAMLASGYTVHPVRRGDPFPDVAPATPVLIATGESALGAAIANVPAQHRRNVILVQNELFSSVWTGLGLDAPTVAMVWFAKKPAQPIRVAQETTAYGPHAAFFCGLCEKLNVPARELTNVDALTLGLVIKYAFILSINALGLEHAETIGWWLAQHKDAADAMVQDAVALGSNKCGAKIDTDAAHRGVRAAMNAMADYPARGRSAPQRVTAATSDAATLGLTLPALVRAHSHLN